MTVSITYKSSRPKEFYQDVKTSTIKGGFLELRQEKGVTNIALEDIHKIQQDLEGNEITGNCTNTNNYTYTNSIKYD